MNPTAAKSHPSQGEFSFFPGFLERSALDSLFRNLPQETEGAQDCPALRDWFNELLGRCHDTEAFALTLATAEGFVPLIAEDNFHAHFFWDIYSPDQAGTNAASFGVDQGTWELTDDQPFVSADEMLVSRRPPTALQICVTVANAAHAVVDPREFHCVPIPEGM